MNVGFRSGSDAAATVTSSATSLTGDIPTDGFATDLVFEIANTGAALTGLALEVKAAADSAWVSILSGSAWGTLSSALVSFGGTLHTLASGATGAAHVRLGPWHAVRLTATCGTSTSVVTRSKVRRES